MDARDPLLQALHRVTALLGRSRVLQDLRHRRSARALPGRARPAARSASRIAYLGIHPSAVRALLTAARQSADPSAFALVAMLGLLGLRIFEATGADITDLAEEHGHRVLRVCGKGTKVVLIPLPPRSGGPSTERLAGRSGSPRRDGRRGCGWPCPGRW